MRRKWIRKKTNKDNPQELVIPAKRTQVTRSQVNKAQSSLLSSTMAATGSAVNSMITVMKASFRQMPTDLLNPIQDTAKVI